MGRLRRIGSKKISKSPKLDSAKHRGIRAAELAGIGYCSFDIETGQYLTCDERYADMIGETVDSMLQLSVIHDIILKRMHPDDIDPALAVGETVLKGGKADATFRVSHKSGGYRFVRQIFEPDPNSLNGNRAVHAVAQDLTELYTLQQSLLQSQKLDAIGQLTGGIAHDFNNILAVIIGNLELIEEQLKGPQPGRGDELKLIQTVVDASFRGAELTKNLLSFARKAHLNPKTIDLNAIVSRARTWIGRTIPASIDIETSLLAGLWPICADETALENTLLNLIINARDAMPMGGKLTIETSNLRIDENYLLTRNEDIPIGRYVMLAVSDTGRGIEDSDVDKIFEPFFTTKPVGDGTGLGLSAVQGFVKQSGGTIQVYSEPGHGTTFKLYFPSVSAETQSLVQTESVSLSTPAVATILLVEDEASVREVLAKSLQSAGYTVLTSVSGDDAFRRFKDLGKVDLLLTDIVMPGELQGTHLARKLRELEQDLPVIFLSGYASEATVHGNGLRPEDIRLMKPVSKIELLNSIDKALRGCE